MGTVNKLFSDRNRRSLGLEPVGVTRGYGDAEDYPGALATGEFHRGLLAALQRAKSAHSLRSRENAAARARALRFVCRRSRYASVSTTSDAANCG